MLPGGVFNQSYARDVAIVRTRTQWLMLLAALAFVFSIPAFANDYWLGWLTKLFIVIIAVLGLHILTGLCGQFSIGHAAFVGVGAYTAAILTTKYGLSGWLCLPLSALVAGVVGLFFALPCFRLKGFYLAVSTLAASFIIIWCMRHFASVTGGLEGLNVSILTIAGVDLTYNQPAYWLAAVITVGATFAAKNIQRTSTGRAFVAIRDNELAAEVNGIHVFRYKMLAFFISCLFAGVAGWLWASTQMRVTPDQFTLNDSIWYFGMLVIGGMGSTAGVFFGAVSLRLLRVIIDQIAPMLNSVQLILALNLVVFSAVIVLFLLFEPRGMAHLWEKVKMQYRLHPFSD
jgi:branched-chain amino acid transport system permease protein